MATDKYFMKPIVFFIDKLKTIPFYADGFTFVRPPLIRHTDYTVGTVKAFVPVYASFKHEDVTDIAVTAIAVSPITIGQNSGYTLAENGARTLREMVIRI